MKTPTLDRISEIQEQSRICGDFLKWLQRKYAMFDKSVPREAAFFKDPEIILT